MVPGTESCLVQELRDARVWDPTLREVGFLQTHVSWLFFTDDRVFKVKRPVSLGFLDFTTLEARRRACADEVRLNGRLAPGVHLGVAPVVRGEDGQLHVGPVDGGAADGAPDGAAAGFEGELVEWAVVMRRLPAAQMLDRRLERGEVDNDAMDVLARVLVDFHTDAATGPGVVEHGHPAVAARHCEENFEALAPFCGKPGPGSEAILSSALLGLLSDASQAFLRDHEPLLRRRVARGRVREGHGDLHAANICWVDDRPVIYDRIEFAAEYRCSDVAADLAFLAMDLDLRGFRGFSRYLVRRYARLCRDAEVETLIDFYKTYRAVVRAKVEALRSADGTLDDADRGEARLAAMRHLHLAASYQLSPALVLMCGLPGVGKSVMARGLAAPFEALVVRSDVLRKQRQGAPPAARRDAGWNEGPYAPEAKAATYQALLDECINSLEHGRPVVADASFAERGQRRRFKDAAQRLGHPCVLVHVECPAATVRQRLDARAADRREASDAGWDTHLRAREAFEAPTEVHPMLMIRADSGELPEHTSARIIDRLVEQTRSARLPD